jgi:radical SAM protein with 4Fe4S-binding SPASM domain
MSGTASTKRADWSRTAVPGPERAWIVTTSQCNLNCLHCARSIPEFREAAEAVPDMDAEMFERFETQVAPSLRTVQFGGTNLGEPMMSRKLEEYVERLQKSDKLQEVKIQTNGTYLLNRDRLERLIRDHVRIMVSLEGVTDESYLKVRGVEFSKIKHALMLFQELRHAHPESKSDLLLAFTVRYDTLGELVALVALAAEVGASQVTLTHFVPVRESHRYQSLYYHRGEANEAFAAAEARARELGVHFVAPAPFALDSMADNGLVRIDDAPAEEPPCYHPWTSVSVNEQGDVMPCCATNTVLGNLKRQNFESIWNGARYRKLRERINTANPPSYCRGCLLRGVDLDAPSAKLFTDEKFLLRPLGVGDAVTPKELLNGGRRMLMQMVRRRIRSNGFTKRAALALRRLYWRHS